MTAEEITPDRRTALLGAALHAVAWELVEYETDTADRGVSEAHYRDAVERAKAILPTLMPAPAAVVAEEPEWEYGWRSRFASGGPVFQELEWGSREQAEQSICDHEKWEADDPEQSRLVYELVKRTPAVRAGEWVPVKQKPMACAHEDVEYQRDYWACRDCGHREDAPRVKQEGAQ